MFILLIIVVVAVLGIMLVKHIDQRRWQRYQFERDMFFRQYPFQWQGLEQFELVLNINVHAQKKLINELMLRASENSYIKKSRIQREPECSRQQYSIKVMIQDLTIGHLEKKYADLQFQNCLDQALQIQIFRQHDQLVATLVAQQHLKEYTLKFIVKDSKTHRIVRTLQDQKQIEQSIYLLNSPAD